MGVFVAEEVRDCDALAATWYDEKKNSQKTSVISLGTFPPPHSCETCELQAPFSKPGSCDLLQQGQFFGYFPLLWFPLQLFRQRDPPRSASVFLRSVLLVGSLAAALRLQSPAAPASLRPEFVPGR